MEPIQYTPYMAMLSLTAEMVLDQAIRNYREQMLYQKIDCALAKGDEASFISLTNELKLLKL
ncbi:MAG: IDEAL domain-containing protein [Paenibacillus sp. RIFOXYA1_FULL_44_5]|nr:MAG: IDEAL domain-containing protein [Paenibacillus sp. RIFOXYA1_FULL_44_5]